MNPEKWRKRTKNALHAYFRRHSFPRLTLSLLLVVTGGVGFFISDTMLRLGVDQMWIRYPIAVLASYAFLLGLIRLWVEIEKARFDPESAGLESLRKEADKPDRLELRSVREHSWFDYLDLPDVGWLDFDEGCLPVMLILALIAMVVLLVTTVAGAPVLLAEVFLDAFILSALYRRLRVAQREHWLGTALRKTWKSVLIIAILLSISGWVLEKMAPGARSMGKAIEQIARW